MSPATATKTVTIDGNGGDDVITGSSTLANTLNGGEGNDNITGGSAVDTIDGGAGDDVITSGTGLDQLTGGAGSDTFDVVAGANGNIYATISDFVVADDTIQFTDQGAETFNSTKVSLAPTATFQDYLDNAAIANGGTNANVSWFQFDGDTFVVNDLSASTTNFVNGTDEVVKLTGLIDLSTQTVADFAFT